MFVLQKNKNNHYKSLTRTHLIGVKEIIQDGGSLQCMQMLLSCLGAVSLRQDVSEWETSSVLYRQQCGPQRLMGMLVSEVWWWSSISNASHESYAEKQTQKPNPRAGANVGEGRGEDDLVNAVTWWMWLSDASGALGEASFISDPHTGGLAQKLGRDNPRSEEYWDSPGGAEVGRGWWRVISWEHLDVDPAERPQMQRPTMKTASHPSQRDFYSCSLCLLL